MRIRTGWTAVSAIPGYELKGGGICISLKVCVLGSGSSGNTTLVASSKARVLIDAGFSYREIFRRMKEIGEDPAYLSGVVITHEHADHVKGLPLLSRRLHIPTYCSEGTWKVMGNGAAESIGEVHIFAAGKGFMIGDIGFESFPVLHDAADPVGLCLYSGGSKMGIATDLGKITHLVREALRDAQCLIIESNHDPGMLIRGPYPWWLKQRIKGIFGHLSNEDSASLLADLLHADLRHVVLAHVSKVNNLLEMVHLNALRVLQQHECRHIRLQVAMQEQAIEPIELA